MRGLGTIINVGCIVLGGIAGLLFGKKINERIRETLMTAAGIAVIFLGIAGCMEKMLTISENKLLSGSSLMMIISLALGAVLGELLNIQGGIEKFGAWLKIKSGNKDDNSFIGAFVSSSCTVCIGAMAIIGAMQDGISGDIATLAAKGLLDAIIICIMTASQGKGCIFSAIPVGIFQGIITVAAYFAGSFLSETSLCNISLVGSILIACVGLNLIREKQIRVANLLPSVILAAAFAYLPFNI